MFRRWFLDHPHSLGESYGEHQKAALAYAASLAVAAMACFVHALIPCLFERTASQSVTRLYEHMRARTKGYAPHTAGTPMPDGAIRVTRTHHSG